MRLSAGAIQEFLSDWLGLEISVGTLHATLHESGAAVLPLKTNWWKRYKAVFAACGRNVLRELNTLLWLWVSAVKCGRLLDRQPSSELLINVLGSAFQGWLMSDGWQVTVITSNAFVAGALIVSRG